MSFETTNSFTNAPNELYVTNIVIFPIESKFKIGITTHHFVNI